LPPSYRHASELRERAQEPVDDCRAEEPVLAEHARLRALRFAHLTNPLHPSLPMVADDERMRADLTRLRGLMALRTERERQYTAALVNRESARRAYVLLVGRHEPLNPDAHHEAQLQVHAADLALDAASRAVIEIKRRSMSLASTTTSIASRAGVASSPRGCA